MGGGEDARRRCHCQKTLTPPDEASVDASTHNTAQHTRARTPAEHTLSEHTQGPNAHARRVPSDGRWAPGTLHTYTQLRSHAGTEFWRTPGVRILLFPARNGHHGH